MWVKRHVNVPIFSSERLVMSVLAVKHEDGNITSEQAEITKTHSPRPVKYGGCQRLNPLRYELDVPIRAAEVSRRLDV